MLSPYLKSAARALIAVVAAAFLGYILDFIVPHFRAEDHILTRLFTLTADHFLLLSIVAVGVALGARALAEGSGGPR